MTGSFTFGVRICPPRWADGCARSPKQKRYAQKDATRSWRPPPRLVDQWSGDLAERCSIVYSWAVVADLLRMGLLPSRLERKGGRSFNRGRRIAHRHTTRLRHE